MSTESLLRSGGATLPRPFDPARAERTFEALATQGFVPEEGDRALLAAAFGNSPFLSRLAIREHTSLNDILRRPAEVIARAGARALAASNEENAERAMSSLRGAKRQAALTIALADIAGLWDVDRVTFMLSEFADCCVRGALRFELRGAAKGAGLVEADGAKLENETGLVVLAMGKYGAFELNYSSDVDLVVFYDAARFPFRKRDDPRGAAVDIVRGLVRLLSETTADGYVFRIDLRLRPDAGATQIAISTEAAESYYEAMGQNWERAAFIKARACAGDPASCLRFLRSIEPFVWRRNLDYAAIDDIHSIKRQIHAQGGHGAIAVGGHNIKLGRGGIREIEFFAQTQQLIAGGRNPNLRPSATLAAIDALCARGLVAEATAQELKTAYRFLRSLEHRLQMIEDEQTHTLPKSESGLAHIACFMGFDDAGAFGAALTHQLQTVQGHYARLFESAPDLTAGDGSLVFTGVEDDPETIATLTKMGFRAPSHVAKAVRGWHHGRIRATRSARARELLTRLIPVLLPALARTADPDAAFMQFDRFVSNLPAGVQLFSLFLARPELLRLIAEISGSAPRLARYLGRFPSTLDALLDADFLTQLPPREALDRQFDAVLASSANYENALDIARRFAKEQAFRVGVQVIEGAARPEQAGPAFANIAECVVSGLLPVVEAELAIGAGRIKGGEFAVVAMGKLGGREMTAGSDLDLIFVYDAPPDSDESDGPKPLPLIVYYARLAQRFITALTSETGAGRLYEVDMRLRPTGNKGPAAVSLDSFARYHAQDAWTWERLALTRARVILAPDRLRRRIEDVVAETIAKSQPTKVRTDAFEMRKKLAAQFPGHNRWDLKYAPGGLIDIEFIAQTLQLSTRRVADTNTVAALKALEAMNALAPEDARTLLEAAGLEHALTQVLRIALDGTLEPADATPGLKMLLARAGGTSDFTNLESSLFKLQDCVRSIFNRLIG
jgi:glutamate-ammonia-ligase adenylyltransferase